MHSGINSLMRQNRKAQVVPPPAPAKQVDAPSAYIAPPFFNPDPEPTRPLNDVEIFFNRCAGHDWYYYFSDDRRVFTRGEKASKSLKSLANSTEVFLAIYNAWYLYKFSGPNFGTEQAPRPDVKNFTVSVDA